MNRREFFIAGASALALPLLPSLTLVAQASIGTINASTVLTNAQRYLGVPYKYGGTDPAVALDCSAYVSLAWQISRQTTDTIQGYSYQISKSELLPGDALNLADDGRHDHIRLFAGWATADQTIAWVYEAAFRYGVAYHVVGYDDRYTPIRRDNLNANVPLPAVNLPLDYDVPNGHFFSQTGDNAGLSGFTVSNTKSSRFWNEFRRYGGVDVVGLPLTSRFDTGNGTLQYFQNGVFQWDPDIGMADFSALPADWTSAVPRDALTPSPSPLLPKPAPSARG
jgi:hypothetical protein